MAAGRAKAAAACLALALVLSGSAIYAQQAPAQNGPGQDPAAVSGSASSVESETERQIDEIMETVDRLMEQNNQLLESAAGDEDARDAMERNDEAILRLMERLDALSPPILVAEVSESDERRMNAAMEKLAWSGLPLLEMGIDPPTGSLGVTIDADRAGPYTEERVREIAAGIDLKITYDTDRASFQ